MLSCHRAAGDLSQFPARDPKAERSALHINPLEKAS